MSWLGGVIQGISDVGTTVAGAVQAEKQRDWMEHMRETAYQDMVKDLTKAGLNPALAFGGGSAHPASTPSAPGFVPTKSDVVGAVEKSISAAKEARAMRDQLDTIAADKETSQAKAYTAWKEAEASGQRFDAEISSLRSQAERNFGEAKLMLQQEGLTTAQRMTSDVNRALLQSELPEARAKAGFYESDFGTRSRQVKALLETLPLLRGGFDSRARR